MDCFLAGKKPSAALGCLVVCRPALGFLTRNTTRPFISIVGQKNSLQWYGFFLLSTGSNAPMCKGVQITMCSVAPNRVVPRRSNEKITQLGKFPFKPEIFHPDGPAKIQGPRFFLFCPPSDVKRP